MIRTILGPKISDVVTGLIGTCGEIYLVGGAVRDHLLNISSHDFDFVVKNNALKAAKICADRMHGSYYALDQERGTGRVLLELRGESIILDFATLASKGIRKDLELRDFTFNAMAVDLNAPDDLIDPLSGAQALHDKIMRPCSASSFENDPIRTIRAIRFQQRLELQVEESTATLIRSAAPGLKNISAERKRDELFAVFESAHIKESCLLLQSYQIWDEVFPYLSDLDQLEKVPRHVHSLMDHTLQVLDYSQILVNHIKGNQVETDNKFVKSGWEILDEFQIELDEYFAHPIHSQRQYGSLLFLAILYHDLSKVNIIPQEVGGKIGFPDHAQKSAEIFSKTRSNWALSKNEFDFVDRIIRNHTLPLGIQGTHEARSRRELYHFFQRSQSAGVLIGILHLADILATYEDTLTSARWEKARETCRTLLDCWFRKYNQIVEPPVLFTGDELMKEFGLEPGPQIGEILMNIQEGQAVGEIWDRKMAAAFVKQYLKKKEEDPK